MTSRAPCRMPAWLLSCSVQGRRTPTMHDRPLDLHTLPEPVTDEPCDIILLHTRRDRTPRQLDIGHREVCDEFVAYLDKQLVQDRVAVCDPEVAFGLRLRRLPLKRAMV